MGFALDESVEHDVLTREFDKHHTHRWPCEPHHEARCMGIQHTNDNGAHYYDYKQDRWRYMKKLERERNTLDRQINATKGELLKYKILSWKPPARLIERLACLRQDMDTLNRAAALKRLAKHSKTK